METIHVAVNGDDGNSGDESNPFLTLSRALEAYRTAGEEKGMIVIHEGAYYETELELRPQHSGLRMKASPGEEVVLYGGREISGWSEEEDGLVSVDLPEVKNGSWDFRALAVDDQLAERARLPEEGRFQHENEFDVEWMSSTDGGWEREPTEEELTTLHYQEDDLGEWFEPGNAEVTVYHQWDASTVGVKDIKPESRRLTLSQPCGHPPGAFADAETGAGMTYVVWNVREGLQHPGQWYLDRERGKLWYWPRPDEDVSELRIVAPVARTVISVRGTDDKPVRDVTIEGLDIRVTTTELKAGDFAAREYAGAITANQCYSLSIRDVRGQAVGGHGIKIQKCPATVVDNCEVCDAGAGGIYVSGRDSEVMNCRVRNVGQLYPGAAGMSVGSRMDACHNEIYDTPYSGIIAGSGRSTLIAKNIIVRVMQELHDGAAVYVGFCEDYTVRDNIARSIVGHRAHAYYLDEQARKCVVEGNLAVKCPSPSHNHMAERNAVRNNLFMSEAGMQVVFLKCAGFTFDRNILVATGDILFSHLDALESIAHNVIYSESGEELELERREDDPSSGDPLHLTDSTVGEDPRLRQREDGQWESQRGDLMEQYGISRLEVGDAGRGRSIE